MLLERVCVLRLKGNHNSWKRFFKMATSFNSPEKTDHLQRTSQNTRQQILTAASIVSIKDESQTVKSLELKIKNPQFSFKAGQWVDTHIPGVETVGGFSMSSSPGLLQKEGILNLAVKISSHPPAHWVHKKCQVGDVVQLRVGGDYFYDPSTDDPPHSLLLVAGGVGINPLMSMMEHVHYLRTNTNTQSNGPKNVTLLFSAKTEEELLFKKRIDEMCEDESNGMNSVFFITEGSCKEDHNTICKRIKEENIRKTISKLNTDRVECFLCGPSPMVEDIETMLRNCGVSDSHIHYERWW